MKNLHIYTPNGDHFVVDQKGNFIQYNEHRFEPDGTWRMVCLEELRPFGNIRHITFSLAWEMIELRKINFRFKNGNPRYSVGDLDHGTRRIWGNTKYHGVMTASIA